MMEDDFAYRDWCPCLWCHGWFWNTGCPVSSYKPVSLSLTFNPTASGPTPSTLLKFGCIGRGPSNWRWEVVLGSLYSELYMATCPILYLVVTQCFNPRGWVPWTTLGEGCPAGWSVWQGQGEHMLQHVRQKGRGAAICVHRAPKDTISPDLGTVIPERPQLSTSTVQQNRLYWWKCSGSELPSVL